MTTASDEMVDTKEADGNLDFSSLWCPFLVKGILAAAHEGLKLLCLMIGPTRSGKSTIAKTLQKLLQQQSNTVFICSNDGDESNLQRACDSTHDVIIVDSANLESESYSKFIHVMPHRFLFKLYMKLFDTCENNSHQVPTSYTPTNPEYVAYVPIVQKTILKVSPKKRKLSTETRFISYNAKKYAEVDEKHIGSVRTFHVKAHIMEHLETTCDKCNDDHWFVPFDQPYEIEKNEDLKVIWLPLFK